MAAGEAEAGGGNAAIAPHGEPGTEIRVARLDDLPRERPISFMKIDVEGFEPSVLRGARGVLERDRPVVLGEFSADWLREHGEAYEDFAHDMAGVDYEIHTVTPRSSRSWRAADTVSVGPRPTTWGQDLLLVPA
jgi:hypothetical protein